MTTQGEQPAAVDDVYLRPGRFVDSDHPDVRAWTAEVVDGVDDPRERAVALYYRVRDDFRYDPYGIDRTEAGFRGAWVLAHGRGFCIPKATLLAAAARAAGIPARLGFADVRNHLTSARLREAMGTDVFAWHGYAELHLDGRWVKATPAFNLTLCEKTGVVPLEFDGRADSIFHEFDAEGRRHMEYLLDHGPFADVPYERILEAWAEHYGSEDPMAGGEADRAGADFEADAAAWHRGSG